ncbi:hypothetical protein [Nonomuraea jiangxiensis]|uniref:Secreted protein n=1 Tax=Nonomuraea jiangxiensis TaxID=633440 RepID=A0A1G9IPM3_9ACTN|nr:hypothetical protein [Nonomuraea jiangxiensis]SDL27209.1 hypothetical protein SAMN05421869_12412 [Nonomuraea jiangxiensis]
MTRSRKWHTRLVSAVAVSILGLAMFSPAPASAAASCVLSITELGGGFTARVTVGCTEGVVTAFDLYGEDGWPNPDDFLIKVWGGSSEILGDHLNEDVGARDEIYAKAFYTTSSGVNKTLKTNRVDGYFGCVVDPLC